MSGLLIAQESVTSATVKWFIVALLVVAVLLTMLTVWYWRWTDPRQRMATNRRAPVDRAPAPRTAPLGGQPVTSADGWTTASVRSVGDPAAEAQRRAHAAGPASGSQAMSPASQPFPPSMVTDDDLEADDWLRLTGPQALPRDGA